MFGIRASSTASPRDFRKSKRSAHAADQARIDGMLYDVIDSSEGGVRIMGETMPRVTLIELYRGGKMIRSAPAVLAWSAHGQCGYAFTRNLGVYEVDESDRPRPVRRPIGGSSIRDQLRG